MSTVFITGANRGLGLALVQHCLLRGDRVFAGCRQPERATYLQKMAANYPPLAILPLDVSDVASIANAAQHIREHTQALDLLINNAGLLVRGERLGNLNHDILLQLFAVNAVGPLLVVQHCLELLGAGQKPCVINVTSQLGSILKMGQRNWGEYSYNASKAALNMLTRKMAYELRPLGIIAIVVHPGWVQTEMGGSAAAVTAEESASGILHIAARLTLEQTGKFYIYHGAEHEW